mgnify:CR=1 FL=1
MSWKLQLANVLTVSASLLAANSVFAEDPSTRDASQSDTPVFEDDLSAESEVVQTGFAEESHADHGHGDHDAGHGGHGGGHGGHHEYQGHLYADEYGWYPPEEHGSAAWQATESITHMIESPAETLRQFSEQLFCMTRFEFETDLSDVPLGIVDTPPRPELIFEYNEGFLKPGDLGEEYVTPNGAVWRPSIWIYGQYRAQFATRNDPGVRRFTELSHRLNIFGQLNLTGTERIILGMRPLDEEVHRPNSRLGREFNSYDFHDGDWIDGWNNDIQTLFFEGDFGELFPDLDYWDSKQLDYGFTVGRQAMIAQQGLLINEDMLDAVTITRNTLSGNGNLNLRISGVFAWNRVSRHSINSGPSFDRNSKLYAILTESDFHHSTVNADIVYVESDDRVIGNNVAWGLSAIQRLHGYHNHYNNSIHILGSHPTTDETATSGQGELIFNRLSWTPHGGLDVIYVNSFWGIDQFTSPARGPLMGGPMGGSLGILFAHTGIGQYAPAIFNQVADSAGGAVGYQMQFDGTRKQVVFEVGGRSDTKGRNDGIFAGGIRYQAACGQHTVWIIDGFVGKRESLGVSSGARVEMLVKF